MWLDICAERVRIVLVNADHGELTQIIQIDARSCIDQAPRGRNDKHTRGSARRTRKRSCIGDFTAKVEAAEKGEHLRDWRALFAAQFAREFELRPIARNHRRSSTVGVSR